MAILNHGSTIRTADGGQSTTTIVTASNIGSYAVASNATYYIGTTQNVFNRASGAQTLTGVSIDGNAASATVLQTARTIGGVSFNGSANINLPGVNTAGNQNTTGTSSNITAYTINQNVGTSNTPSFAGIVSSGITNYAFLQVTDTNNFWITPGNNNWGLYFETSAGGLLGGSGDSNRLGFVGAGAARFYVDLNNGNGWFGASLTANTDSRSPIFYDSGNTAYYLDPANTGTSLLVAGNVGIGTTSPTVKLDIASTQANGIVMRYDTGTAYQSWIRPYWNSGTDTRIDFAINRTANLTPDVIMSVGYGGNVGIGTTSPGTKLDVVGAVTMPVIKQSTTLYAGTDITDDNSTRTVYFNIPAGGYSPITYFKVARIKITGNYQNVSLNGYFTAANSALHVGFERKVEFDFIAYAATNAGAPQVTYIKRGQDTTTVLVYAVANGGGAGTTYYDVYIKHGWYNDTHGELAIRVGYSSAVTVWQAGLDSGTSAPVDTLVNPNSNYLFDTTGFVGIGTTTPAYKLDVNGAINSSTYVYAGVFYDNDNTAYYANPSGASIFNGLKLVSSGNEASGSDYSLWIQGGYEDWGIGIDKSAANYGITYNLASSHTYAIQGRKNGTEYFRLGTDMLSHDTRLQAPIFYDSNDTTFFIDPANGGFNLRGGTSNRVTFNSGDSGIIVTNAEGISSNVRLGCAWGRPGIYNGSSITVGAETQIDFVIGNVLRAYVDSSSNLFGVSSARAPIFYDSGNTAYYVDPASTSNLVGLTVANTITGSISGNAATASNATQFGGESNTNFLRGLSSGTEANINNYTDNGFRIVSYTGHSKGLLSFTPGGSIGTVQHEYFYGIPTNGWRVRNKTDNTTWSAWGNVVMTDTNQGALTGTVITTGNSSGLSPTFTNLYANVFYDQNDSAYYLDPASTTLSLKTRGYITINNATAPNNLAMLNIGSSGSGETRAIDISGGWSGNENKSITFTHATGSTNIVAQINAQHNGPGSKLRWGKLYHGGDSSTYTMELISESTTSAYLTVAGSVRSPIFYDSGDTNYYLDPAGTSRLNTTRIGNINVGSGTYLNTITPIGDTNINLSAPSGAFYFDTFPRMPGLYDSDNTAYYLDPASTSLLNGTRNNSVVAGSTSAMTSAGPLAIYSASSPYISFHDGGVGRTAYMQETGGRFYFGEVTYTESEGSFRAPLFYDVNDTNYYVDPASSSVLNFVRGTNFYDGTGTYNVNLGSGNTEGRGLVAGYSGGSYGGIGYNVRHTTTGGSWIAPMADTSTYLLFSNGVYFYYAAGGTAGRTLSYSTIGSLTSAGIFTVSGDSRAPIFYDSNNTSYYLDPNSGSNLYDLTLSGAHHVYLTINPGNNYEAMVRYIGGTGSSWYVGKRTSAQLVGTANFHFYSEAAGATVGGIDTSGNIYSIGSVRSPIFYDSDNTGYYIDAASTSNLNILGVAGRAGIGGAGSRSTNGLTVGFTDNSTFAANNDVGDTDRMLSIVNESSTTNAMAVLGFRVNPNGGTANAMLDIKFVQTGATNTSALHYTFNHGGSFADRFSILSSGNVGIGTISPTQVLDVRGNIKLGADSAGNYVYYVKDNEGFIIRTTRTDVTQEGLFRSDGWGNFTFNNNIGVGLSLGTGYGVGSVGTGIVYANGSVRAPIFYDSNNTAYYIDAASTSNLVGLTVANTITGSITGNAGGSSASCTGNAATATILQTARNINGTSFNGSAAITTATWGTARTLTIGATGKSVDGSAGVSWSLAEIGALPLSGGQITGNTTFSADNHLTFGPNSSWGSSIRIGGNGYTATGTETASVVTTDGNLHLDAAKSTNGIYLNWYGGTSGVFFGNGSSGQVAFVSNTGNASFSGVVDATQFRDASNTAYYVDPASTSNLLGLTVTNTITGSITGNAGGSSASCTGNAATATILQTARNINGTSFNGSAAITTATWGTARTLTIGSTGKSVDGSANVSWSLAELGAAATNQTMFIGTTSVAINRSSASQTLTGVSIDGNSATTTLATKATRANGSFYIDDNYGNTVVGLYSATRLQGVFAMGDSYKLTADGTGVGTLYGLAWSHPNFGGVAANLADHGLLILQNGVFKGAWGGGSFRTPSDIRGTLFYDWDNTGYYCDPASTSNLNAITAAGNITAAQYYTGGWFRNNSSGNGLYNETTGQHFYSDSANYWNIASSASAQGIRLRTGGHNGTVRGYFYADTNNHVGILNQDGNWRLRVVGGDYSLADGSSMRAQIFYDSNDTSYYVDPNSGSNLVSITNRENLPGGSGNTYYWSGSAMSFYWTKIANVGGGNTHAAILITYKTDVNYNPFGLALLSVSAFNSQTFSVKLEKLNGDSMQILIRVDNNNDVWLLTAAEWSSYKTWKVISKLGSPTIYYSSLTEQLTTPANSIEIASGQEVRGNQGAATSATVSTVANHLFGGLTVRSDVRAPIFYDSDDTAFYLDPAGTSNLNKFSTLTMSYNDMNSMHVNSPYVNRYNGSSLYRNGTMGYGTVDCNVMFSNWGSGFIDSWSSPANAPGGSTHYVGLQGFHYNHVNNSQAYGFQMLCAGEADNRFFWRSAWPNLRSWVEMIHSGNIGSQTVATAGSCTGNSATVTNGVYTTGDQSIGGAKTFTRINFGATGSTPYSSAAGEGFGNGITFGGDENSGYYRIFTTMENVGGNYSKLALNWHTGIRIGAYPNYGGVRFYNNAFGNGTEIFSVGSLDSNVRVVNTIYAQSFYDINNTAYYIDPNSTSNIVGLTVANTITGSVSGSSASCTGNAATATTLQTARTLTIGSTGKTFNGSANVSWSLAEIGALPLAGGTMTGAISTNVSGTSIFIGNQNVSTSNALRINWHTDADLNYFIGKRGGAWTQPMDIAFYTGIKYHANSTYNAHIFYVGGFDTTEAFSIGKGDNHVRVNNYLYAPLMYDTNDTAFYCNPGGNSIFNTIKTNNVYGGNASVTAASSTTINTAYNLTELTMAAFITTLTFSNIQSSGTVHMWTIVTLGNGSATSVTWPAAIKWPGGTAPNITGTNTKRDIYQFVTYDGGTNIYAIIVGQNL